MALTQISVSAAKLDIWLVTAPTRTVVVATEAVTVVEVATAIAERAFPAAAGDICHVSSEQFPFCLSKSIPPSIVLTRCSRWL